MPYLTLTENLSEKKNVSSLWWNFMCSNISEIYSTALFPRSLQKLNLLSAHNNKSNNNNNNNNNSISSDCDTVVLANQSTLSGCHKQISATAMSIK